MNKECNKCNICLGSNYYTKCEVDILLKELEDNIINNPEILKAIEKIIDEKDLISDIKLNITNKTTKIPAVILNGELKENEET